MELLVPFDASAKHWGTWCCSVIRSYKMHIARKGRRALWSFELNRWGKTKFSQMFCGVKWAYYLYLMKCEMLSLRDMYSFQNWSNKKLGRRGVQKLLPGLGVIINQMNPFWFQQEVATNTSLLKVMASTISIQKNGLTVKKDTRCAT